MVPEKTMKTARLRIRLFCLAAAFAGALSAGPALRLQLVCEPLQPGGWAQIKLYVPDGTPIASGTVSLDLDPTFFGAIGNVAVFSVAGDTAGYAHVNGSHVDATFSSPSGGTGRSPGIPVLTVDVAVQPGLQPGTSAVIALDLHRSSVTGALGKAYSLDAPLLTVPVGGTFSVQGVNPGGGTVPRGGVVTVMGMGFDSATQAEIEGSVIASTRVISPTRIEVTLASSAEMTGRRLRLMRSGEQYNYFLALPSTPASGGDLARPLLPLTTYRLVEWSYPIAHPEILQYFALQNPTAAPVTASFFNGALISLKTVTIPPGALYFPTSDEVRQGPPCTQAAIFGSCARLFMVASAPIRMMAYQYRYPTCSTCAPVETTLPPTAMSSLPEPSSFVTTAASQSWSWQIGHAQPPPANVQSQLLRSRHKLQGCHIRWCPCMARRCAGLRNNPSGLQFHCDSQTIRVGTRNLHGCDHHYATRCPSTLPFGLSSAVHFDHRDAEYQCPALDHG